MQPLDLTIAPPREPHAELAGVIFLPRTIDKARASLPGGKLGVYRMEGLSAMLLDRFGIPLEEFVRETARAVSDDEVASSVRRRTSDDRIEEWNEFVRVRRPFGGDRSAALAEYPWLDAETELPLSLDVLVEDDRRLFGARGEARTP